ncbi:MAG TPA: glycogen synthase GlgA [Bryobacteraceae bacterium]|nr:glycogen synthase GlgA [Bryobacteraceae bacterium]
MKILMVASEATPYAKTGGLADVIGALPVALASRGEQVAVVMPLYREAAPLLDGAARAYDSLPVQLGTAPWNVNVRSVENRGVTFYFVERPDLYDRPELYTEAGADYPDNHIRYGVLCHAALAVAKRLFRPDVIHYHDWQASLCAPLMRVHLAGDPTYYGIKLLLTIHNLGYQGLFPASSLTDLGLDRNLFHPGALEFHGSVNLLKGGIVYADAINTVSRKYAEEIQTHEYGFGLEGLLQSRSADLHGIVNGVDYSEWSPECDRYIAHHYSAEDLSGKRECKADLLRTFGLPADNVGRPLIGMVSRFVSQKGFDWIEEIAGELVREDVAIVAIGSGESRYEQMFRDLAAAHPDRVAIRIGYSNEIAHKIEAGSDIFLMPSRYEPCGLNQIYSLRFGTVPVVRATGGLDDTIDESTGFKFEECSGTALLTAIRAALVAFRDRTRWLSIIQAGMNKDFSWNASAAAYSALYRQLGG